MKPCALNDAATKQVLMPVGSDTLAKLFSIDASLRSLRLAAAAGSAEFSSCTLFQIFSGLVLCDHTAYCYMANIYGPTSVYTRSAPVTL